MNPTRTSGFLIVLLLAACATMKPSPNFASLSVSVHDAEGQVAARTLYTGGQVKGSHLSGRRDAPMLAMSTEQARPADLREIAELVRHLPAVTLAPADLHHTPHTELHVSFDDGTSVMYVRSADRPFDNAALNRLLQIMTSYRAGYW